MYSNRSVNAPPPFDRTSAHVTCAGHRFQRFNLFVPFRPFRHFPLQSRYPFLAQLKAFQQMVRLFPLRPAWYSTAICRVRVRRGILWYSRKPLARRAPGFGNLSAGVPLFSDNLNHSIFAVNLHRYQQSTDCAK
jgi:hypothetical protein